MWRFLFFGCELNRPTDKWITEPYEYSEVYGMFCVASLAAGTLKAEVVALAVEGIPGQNPFLVDPKRYGWARKA